MKRLVTSAVLATLVSATITIPRAMAQETFTGDVLIQAGHEGRPNDCEYGDATGASGPLSNEIDWTPIVADEATRILREAGVNVLRVNADEIYCPVENKYSVQTAVFIHFDGSETPCNLGTSVGYGTETNDQPAAQAWKDLYSKHWPYKWMDDNYTSGLSGYYGYSYTDASLGKFLIEMGEVSCLEQAEWLQPRLEWLGALTAHMLSERIGKGNVPDPGPFGTPSPVDVPDLVYIKHTNTAGTVEVHAVSGASAYQQRIAASGSSFGPEPQYGTYSMADLDRDGVPDLVYIKHANTAGTVEVHAVSGASNYQSRIAASGSSFGPEPQNGPYSMANFK